MHEISWREIAPIAATGKVFWVPLLTVDGRPLLHMRPRHENTVEDQAANVRHFAYQMEMITRHADKVSPDHKIVCVIDYTDFCMAKNPPLATSRAVLSILQTHHPERLHEAILWHPPRVFGMLWKMLGPFVDPARLPAACAACSPPSSRLQPLPLQVTKKKMVFLEKGDVLAGQKLAAR